MSSAFVLVFALKDAIAGSEAEAEADADAWSDDVAKNSWLILDAMRINRAIGSAPFRRWTIQSVL
jgi:hypothetical protein